MSEEDRSAGPAVSKQNDEEIARYLALRPWEYFDLERLELEPPLTYLRSGTKQDRVLRIILRSPSTGARLVLAFFGVEQLRFQTDGYFMFHLNITSIRDRHWERLKYIVHEEEEDTLRFYCERFESAMQVVADEIDEAAT